MPKKPVSLTLQEGNLVWLKGRARVVSGGSMSDAVDQLIAEARAGRLGAAEPSRSVVGTIDLAGDRLLTDADVAIRGLFAGSLSRPVAVHDDRDTFRAARARARKRPSKKARG